jgi:hypothetical protein
MEMFMSAHNHATSAETKAPASPAPKPALMSIPDAVRYCGGLGRSTFYKDILPRLKTVRVGTRRLVVVESMDRLIDELQG